MKTPEEIAKKLLMEDGVRDSCECNEGYASRGMVDPYCIYHNYWVSLLPAIAAAIQSARNEGFHKGIDAQLKQVVMLPKEKTKPWQENGQDFGLFHGWNDAISKFKHLNPNVKFEEDR